MSFRQRIWIDLLAGSVVLLVSAAHVWGPRLALDLLSALPPLAQAEP